MQNNRALQYRRSVSMFGSLKVIDHVLGSWPQVSPEDLLHNLDGPTAFYLDASKPRTRVVSLLVHGNEPSGLIATMSLLPLLARRNAVTCNIVLLLQNVRAARESAFTLRYLADQDDLNRLWSASRRREDPYIEDVLRYLSALNAEAILDIHDTSGFSPPLAVICTEPAAALKAQEQLAGCLVDDVILTAPCGTFACAASELAPAVLVECGKGGTPEAVAAATDFVQTFLTTPTSELFAPTHARRAKKSTLLGSIKLTHRNLAIGMYKGALPPQTLLLNPQLEAMNRRLLEPGDVLAYWEGDGMPLCAVSQGADITDRIIAQLDKRIVVREPFSLCMATLNEENIRRSELSFITAARE